jgi:putative DNA primase/helicase
VVRLQIQGEARPSIFDSIFTFDDFMSIQIPPRRVYLAPWIREQDIVQVYGGRGCGKSWFILQALLSITRGVPFGMWECIESVPCMYFDGELIVSDLQDRFKYFASMISIPAKSELHFLSNAQRTAQKLQPINLTEAVWREELKQILITKGIKVWAIDNLASLTPGLDENCKKDWDPINSWFIDLKHSGLTTIFLHHTGKGGQQRGTSAREDNIDHSIQLSKPISYEIEDGCHFVVHFDKHRLPRKSLHFIIDTDMKLIEDEKGNYTWVFSNVKTEARKDALKLIAEGYSMQEIATRLKVGKGTVSRFKKEAIENNLMIENGTLTPDGKAFCWGENDE